MRFAAALLIVGLAQPAWAQVPSLNLKTSLVFYGDDTEFSNPFRTGETILGTYGVAFLEVGVNERFKIRAGGFGNWRFGSSEPIDQGRPVLALVAGSPRSYFVLGTLETMRHLDGRGPDRTGPHGLLPPMQREVLSFQRAYEAGMQWIVDTPRYSHDGWINWQRINTSDRREVFDVGYASLTRLRPEFAIRGDIHVVHAGGQNGGGNEPVADSVAAAAGVEAGAPVGRVKRMSLELIALGSRTVFDRTQPDLTRGGFATFLRYALDWELWRVHLILWRANGFVKAEGDPLYQAIRHDGSRYEGIRDYAETGITRRFKLAPDTVIETSLRFHRTEDNYEFSFRVLGVAHLNWRLK